MKFTIRGTKPGEMVVEDNPSQSVGSVHGEEVYKVTVYDCHLDRSIPGKTITLYIKKEDIKRLAKAS